MRLRKKKEGKEITIEGEMRGEKALLSFTINV